MPPRRENCPGPSTWWADSYPASNRWPSSCSTGSLSPGFKLRVRRASSSRGMVRWMAALTLATTVTGPAARRESTRSRSCSYSRETPSTSVRV